MSSGALPSRRHTVSRNTRIRINRDSPDDSQTNANIRAFSGLAARLTRGVDGYQQLGQPERWSSS
jgi:hypothetical protein